MNSIFSIVVTCFSENAFHENEASACFLYKIMIKKYFSHYLHRDT